MNWQRNSRSYNVNEAFVLDETLPKGKKETIRERSDSQSSVEDDGPMPHPRGLPTKAESIDFGLDEVDTKKPFCNCLMGCFIVFFVMAMMTCVAIILYFVLINTVFADTETKALTGALTVEGSLLLNEAYHPDLADPQSMAFREMENKFLSSMNASFSNSTLADNYDGAKVERFEQGSIRIVFAIFFLSAPNNADTEAGIIFEVQVTIGDGIYSGFFDDFDVIENSLEITTVNQQSRTTTETPTTSPREATGDITNFTTIFSGTSEIISSLTTLLSTSVTTAATVTKPTTTRVFSSHLPTSPTFAPTPSTTLIKSTTLSPTTKTKTPTAATTTVEKLSSTMHRTTQLTTVPLSTTDLSKTDTTTTVPSTPVKPSIASSTITDNSTGTFHFTNKVTNIPPSSTYAPTSDSIISTTTPSTDVNLSTTPTTIDNSTGSFHFTVIPTTIPPSPVDTTLNTTPSVTRIISSTIAETTETTTSAATTTPTAVASTNDSFTNLMTSRPSSTDSLVSVTPSSSTPTPTSPASEVNITRQPKIHPALPDVCGIRPALNESDEGIARIVGGTQADAGTWPWMGSLRQGGSHQCGAVLIHQEWAITAHHCIGFFDNIVLGDIDLFGNSGTSPYRVQRNVQSFPNPDFNPVNDNGDIALVRLTEPVEFNDHVQPLCINTLMTEMRSFNNCFVTGWGTDDILNQEAMRYLQEADIQMFDRVSCSQWYQALHTITNQHICAGEEDGRRDACSGDSGGPLQCQDDQGIWYLLGVVSFGQDCGQPRLPGVYTRVSTQITFLSQILDTNIK